MGEPASNETTKGCGYATLALLSSDRLALSASYDVTEDDCAIRPSYTPDGKNVKGATIFVKINCADNKRLPKDQQNPAYNHDGVPAPQSVYDAWIADLPANPSSAATTGSAGSPSPSSTATSQPSCDSLLAGLSTLVRARFG
ncbi:MAG: hypothetical protein Q9219_000671 [cf. Caloplaca sp. 3 TL-2023]